MADPEVERLVEAACQTMEAGCQTVGRYPPGEQQRPGKAELAAGADAIKAEVSKIALLWNQELVPSAAVAQAVLGRLQQAMLHLCAHYHTLCQGGSQALAQNLSQLCGQLVDSCTKFLTATMVRGEREGLHRMAGVVLGRCDAAARAPLDNRIALGRALTLVTNGVKDTLREARELAGNEGEQAGELGEEELKVAGATAELIDVALRLLMLALKCLLKRPAGMESGEVGAWDNLVWHARKVETAVTDLGATLYPPQEREEVGEACDAVHTGCELIIEEFPEGAIGAAEFQLPGLDAELHHAFASVRHRVEEAGVTKPIS